MFSSEVNLIYKYIYIYKRTILEINLRVYLLLPFCVQVVQNKELLSKIIFKNCSYFRNRLANLENRLVAEEERGWGRDGLGVWMQPIMYM